MGQNQGSHSNPLLQDWKNSPNQPNIFTNIKTNEQAESYQVLLNKAQQIILRKRMQQHHNFIAKILYYEPVEKNKVIKDSANYYVYTEKLLPISPDVWVPTTSALSILKGFRRLTSSYGLIRVNPHLIKVNNKKQLKVWINQNIISGQAWQQAQSQQQMLADIVKVIMLFDSQTGALMMNCFTINDAINNILHNMTQNNKTQLNFSNRTSKGQQKARASYNSQKQAIIPNKYNFRSTKQTEDDTVKPINQATVKYNNLKKQIPKNFHHESHNPNYLFNVTVPKSPTFINVDETEPKVNNFGGVKSLTGENISRDHNYSQQNNIQKQSSIQFNSSHPIKTIPTSPTGRPFKPVQYKNLNYPEPPHNLNPASSHLLAYKYQKSIKQPERFAQFDRKSNLSRNYLQKVEMSQDGEMSAYQKAKGSIQFNQRSEANTSREFMQAHSFIRSRNGMPDDPKSTSYIDSNRTKTQQFYSSNNNQQHIGCSPRLRTHYLQSNSQIHNFPQGHQMTKQVVAQSGINTNKNQHPTSSQRNQQVNTQKIKLEVEKVKEKNIEPEFSQQQRRRQQKLKQAQKIKQQMSFLGIQNNSKTLTSDKSARDLIIRQRIDQKNKKHEKLKIEITRLLSQPGENDN